MHVDDSLYVPQALQQYANVRHRDKLRCNAAFFMGLLKQVAEGKAGKAQIPELNSPKPLFTTPSSISPEARQKLNELYTQGVFDSTFMQGPCLGLLAALPKSAQLGAVVTLAMKIDSATNKQAYITQRLKGMIMASNAASGLYKGHQSLKPGTASAVNKLVSNTGKVINPNEVSIRLNPSSAFYDSDLAMCWRVLTKQDKAAWQARIGSGQRPKLKSLSLPRQKLAKQLHPSSNQYHHATAAAWKHIDAADKESLLQTADATGEDICTAHSQPKQNPDPSFLDMDFPPLGGSPESQPKKAKEEDNDHSTAAAQAAVTSNTVSQTHTGIDNSMVSDTEDAASENMPLHNMGMAFQHSFSLMDMMQPDPSIATSSPTGISRQVMQTVGKTSLSCKRVDKLFK